MSSSVDGQPRPGIEYLVAGTPCERVLAGEPAIYPDSLQELFPSDRVLVELGIHSYAAGPLFDSEGQPLGHVGVMGRRALEHPGEVEALLMLFAGRIQAEIERLRAEAQFRDLFELSPDGLLLIDGEGTIVTANAQAEVLSGYAGHELAGMPVDNLVPEEYRRGHGRHRAAFTAAGVTRAMGAGRRGLRLQRKDGTYFAVEISLAPMASAGTSVVLATFRDVTAREKMEDELRQAQKLEAIGTLAGGIAHDFNNILAVILGNTELAAIDLAPGHPSRQSLDEIHAAGIRARDLVRQILAFSRYRDEPRVPVSLAPAVAEAAQLARASLPDTVVVETRIAPDAPAAVADVSQIGQVLMNLCWNAGQALEGGGRIDIRLDAVEFDRGVDTPEGLPPGRYVRITVTDTGCGMDAATVERIFEPFFTTRGVGAGTGLGLAVVHGIVRDHGGAIAVHSTPGQGSTFEVYLPAASESAQPPLEEIA